MTSSYGHGRVKFVRRDRLTINNLQAGPPSPTRTYLTGHEVLSNNPRWRDTDRYLLKDLLEGRPRRLTYTPNVKHRGKQLDGVIATIPERLASIYRTRSTRTMIGLDAQGTRLVEIRPGSVHLYMGIDQKILEFSTTHWRTERQPRQRPADPVALCQVHYLQLPVSGICDLCV